MTDAPVVYAGFWRRLAAFLIDSLILLALFGPMLYLAYGADYFRWAAEHNGLLAFYSVPEFLVTKILPVVLVVALWTRFGWTPGKLLLDCRVVDATTGRPLTLKQSLLRYFGYLVSMLPLYAGFIWIAWDRRKQGFHDKIAHTVVVRAMDNQEERSLDSLMKEAS